MRGLVSFAAGIATIVIGLGMATAAQDAAAPPKDDAKGPASYGAIAYDEYSGKKGASWNQSSYEEAQKAALKACESEKCLLNTVEPHHCGALAKSDKDRAWSGAERDSLKDAQRDAVARCQSHASAGKCAVLISGCNK
jgi:hypothetical protein